MIPQRLYSTAEALAEVRKDPTIAADPYRLAEVFAALVSGCNEAAYHAGYEAGRRYERGDDEVTDEPIDDEVPQ